MIRVLDETNKLKLRGDGDDGADEICHLIERDWGIVFGLELTVGGMNFPSQTWQAITGIVWCNISPSQMYMSNHITFKVI